MTDLSLLIADDTSFYDSKTLKVLDNNSINKLLQYLPVLNPNERLFGYMKHKLINNKVCTSILELKDNTISFIKKISPN